MSKIRKIISIYLSYRQPRSVRKEFAEWFAAPFDRETKQRLMREYWDCFFSVWLSVVFVSCD